MKKVLCWGTFDLLHEGHLAFLKDAKSRGDYLAVVVISDNTVYENKKKFPINNQHTRAIHLMNTGIVDEVLEVSDDLNKNLERIALYKPNILVFGYDQKTTIETKVRKYLSDKGLTVECYRSIEYANGKHTSNIRNSLNL